jgi:uncharacterized protein YjbI with pentapeptide repeats
MKLLFLCLIVILAATADAWGPPSKLMKRSLASIVVAGATTLPMLNQVLPASAQEQFRLPPIDRNDKDRCEMVSSAMGQANAARAKLFDLRECDLRKQDGKLKDMSGVIGSDADFSGVSFVEGQLSKAYLRNSKFKEADFTNAVVDRVTFDGSDLEGARFTNAVLSGTTFKDANVANADFTDSYLGPFDLKKLCENPTLKGTNPKTGQETRLSAGCGDAE